MYEAGNKDSLHFIIGDRREDDLQQVDIWLKDILLTPIDNMAYLPQFIGSMRYEMEQLETGVINEDGFFLDLGPTTDDCSSRIKLFDDQAKLSFELEEDLVHLLTLPVRELLSTYSLIIDKLVELNA